MREVQMDDVPTPLRWHLRPPADVDAALKELSRLEQEMESDRRFFENPPEDFVRCPTCTTIYAVQQSRPTSPQAVMLPVAYSKELPPACNLAVDEATRHLYRSRFRCRRCDIDFCRCGVSPYHWGWSCDAWHKHRNAVDDVSSATAACRWCFRSCMSQMRRCESLASPCCGSTAGTDVKRFPPTLSCAEKERRSCGRRHSNCGHWCGGVRDESSCLPCLQAECSAKAVARKSAQATQMKLPAFDEWCGICWTESIGSAPAIRLECGHVLHYHCAMALTAKGQIGGRRLNFKSIRCPLCQAIMHHPLLNGFLAPHIELYNKVRRKALQRWTVERRGLGADLGKVIDEEQTAMLAMQKMSFYECSQCKEPYYGGEVECQNVIEDDNDDLDADVQAALAMELICRGCASKGQLQCSEHGTEFLGWKCRFCCESEAHYFCFGNTHFCLSCHDLWQLGMDQRRKLQAGRPCLGSARCIFGGRHPPNSKNGRDEYALGCTVCAQEAESGMLARMEKQKCDKNRRLGKRCSIM